MLLLHGTTTSKCIFVLLVSYCASNSNCYTDWMQAALLFVVYTNVKIACKSKWDRQYSGLLLRSLICWVFFICYANSETFRNGGIFEGIHYSNPFKLWIATLVGLLLMLLMLLLVVPLLLLLLLSKFEFEFKSKMKWNELFKQSRAKVLLFLMLNTNEHQKQIKYTIRHDNIWSKTTENPFIFHNEAAKILARVHKINMCVCVYVTRAIFTCVIYLVTTLLSICLSFLSEYLCAFVYW